jgi:hypothetical protein
MKSNFLKILFSFTLIISFKLSYSEKALPHMEYHSKELKNSVIYDPGGNQCLQIAMNQVTIASNLYYQQMLDCNQAPGPTAQCAQTYITHINLAYAIIEANLNSCEGGGYALEP